MGFHTFDPDEADRLDDPTRYAYLSVEELLALFDPGPTDVIADLGSGTGFYTTDVAPEVDRLYAVDLAPAMHEHYRTKGIAANVTPITALVGDLPFLTDSLDAAVSTMTFHEFATAESCADVARTLRPGGRIGIADWSANGTGERGPPVTERYDAERACKLLETAGFVIDRASERRETFVIGGRLPTA